MVNYVKMIPTTQRFRVLVVAPLASIAGRMRLSGIYKFLNEGYDWEIELIRSESEFTPEIFSDSTIRSFDGIFIGWNEKPELQKLHAQLSTPSVLFDPEAPLVMRSVEKSILVHDDVNAVVRAARSHFFRSGRYSSYGFVPTKTRTFWSDRRQKAFVAEMARHGAAVATFGGENLDEWLMSLPKPAGILCAFDDRAADVLLACRAAKLAVPEEIAVLGIGDDAQICENTRPRLSSVAVDFEGQGYRAARELHAMMLRGRCPRERTIATGAATVVARASTLRESPSGALVRRATEFIVANATRGIGPKDVMRHVRVSRRLLDLRFREVTGKSVQEAIRERRLDAVKSLLSSSNLSIAMVAEHCGYHDANYLKNQFKKAFGTSMRNWRAQNAQK